MGCPFPDWPKGKATEPPPPPFPWARLFAETGLKKEPGLGCEWKGLDVNIGTVGQY